MFANHFITSPYVADFQKILDRLQNNKDIVVINQATSKMELAHFNHRKDHLQKTIAHYDRAIKRKLELHLPKRKQI